MILLPNSESIRFHSYEVKKELQWYLAQIELDQKVRRIGRENRVFI